MRRASSTVCAACLCLLGGCGVPASSFVLRPAPALRPQVGRLQAATQAQVFEAVVGGDVEALRDMLADKTDLTAAADAPASGHGDTPLLIAVESGQVDVLLFLLEEAGVDVNSAPPGKETALQLAAYYGELPLVQLLLAAGADTEVKTAKGDTALGLAAFWGNLEVVSCLLEAGADPSSSNKDGKRIGDEFEDTFVSGDEKNRIRSMLEEARSQRA